MLVLLRLDCLRSRGTGTEATTSAGSGFFSYKGAYPCPWYTFGAAFFGSSHGNEFGGCDEVLCPFKNISQRIHYANIARDPGGY